MKKFPYSSPELWFILLVMLLPLAVGFIWRGETILGHIGRILGCMALGFLVWLGIIFVICRDYDQKK